MIDTLEDINHLSFDDARAAHVQCLKVSKDTQTTEQMYRRWAYEYRLQHWAHIAHREYNVNPLIFSLAQDFANLASTCAKRSLEYKNED